MRSRWISTRVGEGGKTPFITWEGDTLKDFCGWKTMTTTNASILGLFGWTASNNGNQDDWSRDHRHQFKSSQAHSISTCGGSLSNLQKLFTVRVDTRLITHVKLKQMSCTNHKCMTMTQQILDKTISGPWAGRSDEVSVVIRSKNWCYIWIISDPNRCRANQTILISKQERIKTPLENLLNPS